MLVCPRIDGLTGLKLLLLPPGVLRERHKRAPEVRHGGDSGRAHEGYGEGGGVGEVGGDHLDALGGEGFGGGGGGVASDAADAP